MKTLKLATAFAISAVLVLGVVAIASGKPGKSALKELWNTPSVYPEVAVTVNGVPISGKWLSYAVVATQTNERENGKAVSSRKKAVQEAIDSIVDAELINQEVAKRGYTASNQDVTDYLAAQVADLLAHPDPDNQSLLDIVGVATWDDYVAHPAVREDVRKQLASATMFAELEADPKFSLEKFKKELRRGAAIRVLFTP